MQRVYLEHEPVGGVSKARERNVVQPTGESGDDDRQCAKAGADGMDPDRIAIQFGSGAVEVDLKFRGFDTAALRVSDQGRGSIGEMAGERGVGGE